MKNVFKLLGIIALAAVIGFSMAGCKNDDDGGGGGGGGLYAPTGLNVTASGTTIYATWNPVAGASGYTLYVSADNFRTYESGNTYQTSYSESGVSSGTYYFQVSAFNANGESARSNIVSITVTGGTPQPQPNLSINGTWGTNSGYRFTISNSSTGVCNAIGSSAFMKDAANKGYIAVGQQVVRNLSKTGTYTWSGQDWGIVFNTKTPDVAYTAVWINCTITMSTNGQTITFVGPWSFQGSSGTYSATYTRQ